MDLSKFTGFFSGFLGILPLKRGIFEKPSRPSDRARRFAPWSSFGQTWSKCQTNPPWKYSNLPVRYPTNIIDYFHTEDIVHTITAVREKNDVDEEILLCTSE